MARCIICNKVNNGGFVIDSECLTQLKEEIARLTKVVQNDMKNKPLTLEELKQMDGQPVWCSRGYGRWGVIGQRDDYKGGKNFVIGFHYGWEWLEDVIYCNPNGIYRRPPKEGDKDA